MTELKATLIKLHWLLASQFGIDPRRLLRSLRGFPHFLRDWVKFRRDYSGRLIFKPCLHDRYEEAGAVRNEYFWQDLLVARWIYEDRPERHVDVGSRIDGFVAHVASFREIEVLDVRPVTSAVPGIVFKQADLMKPDSIRSYAGAGGYCDSLSCLHAIEHFGLGRYGDPIDPRGHEQGIANLAQLLKPGGILYLSTPIGQERVEFNANRVFDPRSIVRCGEAVGMNLRRLIVITPADGAQESAFDAAALAGLAFQRYKLGLFCFIRTER